MDWSFLGAQLNHHQSSKCQQNGSCLEIGQSKQTCCRTYFQQCKHLKLVVENHVNMCLKRNTIYIYMRQKQGYQQLKHTRGVGSCQLGLLLPFPMKHDNFSARLDSQSVYFNLKQHSIYCFQAHRLASKTTMFLREIHNFPLVQSHHFG